MAEAPTETFNKETFLTSLRDGAQQVPQVYEPKGMADVRDKYGQLTEVVRSLSDQIGAVLKKQEGDFLSAYRAHMYNVQKELHDLRQKIEVSETSEQKNEKRQALEEERNWYRKEALRLDAFALSMKKDLKLMKEKLESIEEDRNWLERQLKSSKKQNKLLRAELEIRLQGFDSSATGTHGNTSAVQQSAGQNLTDEELTAMLEEKELLFRKQIRNLKRELQASRKEVNKLRSSALSEQKKPNELEEFFLRCIDSVKKDISRRRHEASAQRDPSKRSGVKVPTLSDFASNDRVRVIEQLLGHDEVLSFLYDHLFPPAGEKQGSKHQHHAQIHQAPIHQTPVQHELPERSTTTEPMMFSKPSKQGEVPVGSAVSAVSASRGVTLNSTTQEYLLNSYVSIVDVGFG